MCRALRSSATAYNQLKIASLRLVKCLGENRTDGYSTNGYLTCFCPPLSTNQLVSLVLFMSLGKKSQVSLIE